MSSLEKSFSIYGPEGQELERPMGVAVGPSGRIYVTDPAKSRIAVFDGQGNLLLSFGKSGSDDERLSYPTYIALDEREKVYVTDVDVKRLKVFSSKGAFVGDVFPNNDREFDWAPLAVTFDSQGNLYVADIKNHRVVVLKPNRDIKMTIGQKGRNEGRFFYPNGIAVDDEGRIVVADSNNSRFQVFDAEGRFVQAVKTRGLPRGLALSDDGKVYAANTLEHLIEVYTLRDGTVSAHSSEGGFGSEERKLQFPNGLGIDDEGRLYIADRGNGRIQIWTF